MERWDFVIIGAGSAGLAATREIRKLRPQAPTLLVSNENGFPYKRTKLSKVFSQNVGFEGLLLEDASFYQNGSLRIRTGLSATKVDWLDHIVEFSDGSKVQYEKLLIATGSHAALPATAPNSASKIHVFWNREEFESLMRNASTSRAALVVGMGVLGVEMSEQIALRGIRVILIGHGTMPMRKYLTVKASSILSSTLLRNGVSIGYDEAVESVTQNLDGTLKVQTNKSQRDTDILLFCIGAEPSVELASVSGIAVDRGIVVDELLRTSAPDVFAAGDAAQRHKGALSHLWHAAEDQGEAAARVMLGSTDPYVDRGYRLKCEIFGNYFFSFFDPNMVAQYDLVEFENGNKYIGIYSEHGSVRGLCMVNDKDNAKNYEKSVRDQWPLEKLVQLFRQ